MFADAGHAYKLGRGRLRPETPEPDDGSGLTNQNLIHAGPGRAVHQVLELRLIKMVITIELAYLGNNLLGISGLGFQKRVKTDCRFSLTKLNLNL